MNRIVLACALATAACATTYDYDPLEVGKPDGEPHPVRDKSSSQFVRGVYSDLLGRTPTSYELTLSVNGAPVVTLPIDEQAQLVAVLDGIGDARPMRNLLVNGLLHGAEVALPDKAAVADPRGFVRQQFARLLGREPNAYELAAFAGAWSDPAVGPRTVVRAITASREYQRQ
jgi:hypothetical protein